MTKTYTINGVAVSYETYNQAMDGDPNDFGNLNNINAPDIPRVYIEQYTNDRRNEKAGRGQTWWTPRQRMLDNIKHNEQKLKEKKSQRIEQRQAKMNAWGAQRQSDDKWQAHLDLMHRSENERISNQQGEDRKSVIIMAAVIGGGFLFMFLLFYASVYLNL